MTRNPALKILIGSMAVGLAALMGAQPVEAASRIVVPASTTAPSPYAKIFLGRDVSFACFGPDHALLYSGDAWTLAPNIRGPLFAPTVLWLAGAGNQPVDGAAGPWVPVVADGVLAGR